MDKLGGGIEGSLFQNQFVYYFEGTIFFVLNQVGRIFHSQIRKWFTQE